MLKALDELIESRIRDAQSRGEFDRLPGAGRPLPDEDLAGVPEELRVAYRILKNAGCVPPEIEAMRDLDAAVEQAAGGDAAASARARRRLLALTMALEARGGGLGAAALEYRGRLLQRLGAASASEAAAAANDATVANGGATANGTGAADGATGPADDARAHDDPAAARRPGGRGARR